MAQVDVTVKIKIKMLTESAHGDYPPPAPRNREAIFSLARLAK